MALSLLGIFIWHLINQVKLDDNNALVTLILLPILIVVMIIGSIVTIKLQERSKKISG